MGIKTKKVINIVELFVSGLIVWAIIGTYITDNSFSRFTIRNEFLKLGVDVIIIGLLIFRFTKIRLNFNKSYRELEGLITIEKIAYGLIVVFLLPDLLNWYQWKYFVGLYLHVFIACSLPVILWTIEIIERSSEKGNRIRNYGLGILGFVIPVMIFTFYLSQIGKT